jgi:Protein of unknown function (DUF1353)
MSTKPHFVGEVESRWMVQEGEDRAMVLLKDFTFVDKNEFPWVAHTGDVIDGASIPEAIWSQIMGTPFIGDYRRASVVHDVACQRRPLSSKDAHRMFYEAMIADGTPKARALLFYTAVRLFGPKWEEGAKKLGLGPVTPKSISANAESIDFDQFEKALDHVIK